MITELFLGADGQLYSGPGEGIRRFVPEQSVSASDECGACGCPYPHEIDKCHEWSKLRGSDDIQRAQKIREEQKKTELAASPK